VSQSSRQRATVRLAGAGSDPASTVRTTSSSEACENPSPTTSSAETDNRRRRDDARSRGIPRRDGMRPGALRDRRRGRDMETVVRKTQRATSMNRETVRATPNRKQGQTFPQIRPRSDPVPDQTPNVRVLLYCFKPPHPSDGGCAAASAGREGPPAPHSSIHLRTALSGALARVLGIQGVTQAGR
jgi:hypothetical protein